MRVSFEWLRELVSIDITPEELAERLTMAGIAVEEIEDQAAQFKGIVTARVLSLAKHPEADNLWVTQVDDGAEIRQVITAAKNLKQGDLIPLALPGTTLPDGKSIEDVVFKGIISQGMMCSGAELGLEKESSGIWVFDDPTLALGVPVAEVLGETDRVLVLELTPNRSDCLGMLGVARETAAVLGKTFHKPEVTVQETDPAIDAMVSIRIDDPDLCPRYTARVVEGVTIGPSPQWMQRRLKAAGIRPISNIVDITNYVMLEYNQPLHAFDLDRVAEGAIIVRRAQPGEKLVTLDDVERQFQSENLLIADPRGGLCVAGVMGGSSSEVTDQTTRILLESAYFNPASIRKTARQLGMRSEASFRFERGIDPAGTIAALNRAAQLMAELGGGKVAAGYRDVYPAPIPTVTVVTSGAAINRWLGISLPDSEIIQYLERVHFTVSKTEDGQLKVTAPSYRRDVSHMADLAEEVARLYGYNRIPVTIPYSKQIGGRTPFQKLQQECRQLLRGIGATEIISYSLYSKNVPELLGMTEADPLRNTVDLMIPLSEEQAVMRTNLIHSLLETAAYNMKRRQANLAFFEIARVYHPDPHAVQPREPLHLGIVLAGRVTETGWNQHGAEADFYDLKGILELLTEKLRLTGLKLETAQRPFLHPGQAAEILLQGQPLGFLGQVHPEVAKNYDISQKIYVMELDLALIAPCANQPVLFEPLPKFPALQRDLALVAPTEVKAESISAKIEELSGGLVEKVELFDVYQGDQVPPGMRSLAFSLQYRSRERTLNDSEVNQIQEDLLQKLRALYGAQLRL